MIAAVGSHNELGRDNQLLWRIPSDLKRFKALTTPHALLMGRKTFQSIGRPLPQRLNLVLTRNHHFKAEGVEVIHQIEDGIRLAQQQAREKLFIIGGAEIYLQGLPLVETLYLTQVHQEYPLADTFMPEIPFAQFQLISQETGEEQGLGFTHQIYRKKIC